MCFGKGKDYEGLKGQEVEKFVSVSLKWLKIWLLKKNGKFLREFFGVLQKNELINFSEGLEKLVGDEQKDGRFFDLFTVSDASKCRADTEELKEECFSRYREFIKREIDFVKPELIFAFGARTWEWGLQTYFPDIEMQSCAERKPRKVTDDHGHLFIHRNTPEFFVIPLAHFSQRMMNFYLRDSYFEYLEEGLRAFIKTRK